jgi:DNA-directed RNA polymerase subunit RPC12/RpoP
MHEMGCARQNYKCATCGHCVAKADKETHEQEEHTEVSCSNCGFKAMKVKFHNHEKECTMKPQ